MSKNNLKKRYWGAVIYPDSLPSDWLEVIKQSGLEIALSPLHDKDINADETEKKAHYHMILAYSGPTTFNNVKSYVCDRLNGAMPIPLESVKGYYRYFTHKDNPEKFQYAESDIKCFNGFNILNFIELSSTELKELRNELIKLIRDKNFDEYSNLIDYLMDNKLDGLLDYACSNTIMLNNYLKSVRHRRQ